MRREGERTKEKEEGNITNEVEEEEKTKRNKIN